MLQLVQETNHIKIVYNNCTFFVHTPWKPALKILAARNEKRYFIPIRHITAAQTDIRSITLTCAGLIEVVIQEKQDALLITYPVLPADTEAVFVTCITNKNFYIIDIWKHKKFTVKRKFSREIPGPYMYSTGTFIASVQKGTIKIKKTAKHLTLKTPPEGFAVACDENFYQSASTIHSLMCKHTANNLPPVGIYFLGGGGDIALSCKVQTLLDAHIPAQGVIFADLFPDSSLTQSAGLSRYPDLKGETYCYAQSGMIPGALLPIDLELANKQTTIHYSQEIFKTLKNTGIALLGLHSRSSMPYFSLKELAEYAMKNATQNNFPVSFSYAETLPIRHTYQLYYLTPSQTSIQRITMLWRASYGAFSIIAPTIKLAMNIWNDCSAFMMALEFAVFTPILVLDIDTTSERTIPFMTQLQGKILQTMLELYTQLKPYHNFCLQNLITHQAPVHYFPQYIKKQDYFTNTFMYGPDLLIGLRSTSHQKQLMLKLPEGTWIHFWTGLQYESGSVVINVPPGYPAIFYKPESKFADLLDSIRRTGKEI